MDDISNPPIIVRDQRKPGHHWADNEVIDDFGSIIGAVGYAIYMFLCRHAGNRDGRCHKTQTEIGDAFSLNRNTVHHYLEVLKSRGLISIGKQVDNTLTYYILEVPKHPKTSSSPAKKTGNPLPEKQARVPEILARLPEKQASNKEERLSLDFTKTNSGNSPAGLEEENIEDLDPIVISHKVIEELGLPTRAVGLCGAIAGAIQFCLKNEQNVSTKKAATEFLISHGRSHLDAGGSIDRFWFESQRWRQSKKSRSASNGASRAHETPSALPMIEEMKKKRERARQ